MLCNTGTSQPAAPAEESPDDIIVAVAVWESKCENASSLPPAVARTAPHI